ncbi:MAG: RidA family protein [Flavobacteriaceae bacterium]|nr:RidA family protein [Flavobacteriaceae bacterium]
MKNRTLLLSLSLLFIFSSCHHTDHEKEVNQETVETTSSKIEFLASKIERRKSAPYSDAVRIGDILFLTGQVGFNNDSLKIAEGGIKAEATQALENIKAVLEANGSDLEHVAKCTVILTDRNDFGDFNEVFRQYFPKNKPARTTFVADLVIDAKIEIDVIAAVK